MATSVSFHSHDIGATIAPKTKIRVWPDYICITLKRADDLVDFFVKPEKDESMEALVGRVTMAMLAIDVEVVD